MAGGFSAFAGPFVQGPMPIQFAAYIAIGGVASKLGGDKFENGAITAAFAYLFNELLHEKNGLYLSGYETRDPVSNRRIWQLDPAGVDPSIKLDVVTAFNTSEAFGDAPIRVVSGFRTFAEQDALYAQGRTTPGNIVTPARGGESAHNYGLAVDIMRIGDELYNPAPITVETFKRFGFVWGGDWPGKKNDPPHFER
jgi:hypothetical protein